MDEGRQGSEDHEDGIVVGRGVGFHTKQAYQRVRKTKTKRYLGGTCGTNSTEN
jgi:hypothetical protein